MMTKINGMGAVAASTDTAGPSSIVLTLADIRTKIAATTSIPGTIREAGRSKVK